MKRLIQLAVVCFIFLVSMNQNTVYAKRKVGHSKPVEGRIATYELYYHYSEEDDAYGGQHRLSLSVYDFADVGEILNWKENNLSLEEKLERLQMDSDIMGEIREKFPELSPYFKQIGYQVACHELGSRLLHPQPEWDMEIQRQNPIIPYVMEWSDQCNRAYWVDNKLLFNPNVKFHGQTPVPNQWISYPKKR